MNTRIKSTLTKDVSVFQRSVPLVLILLIAMSGLGTAALIQFYGSASGTADVQQSVMLNGQEYDAAQALALDGASLTAGATELETHKLENNADQDETVAFRTSCSNSTGSEGPSMNNDISWNDECEGITTQYVEYFDDAGTSGADLSQYTAPESCDDTISTVDGQLSSLSSASAGETVCVASGTYNGSNLVVDLQDVTVAGNGAHPSDTVINANESGRPVTVTADGVTVTGLKVTDSGDGKKGIRAKGSTDDYYTGLEFSFLEVADNGDRGAVFSNVNNSVMKHILVYGGHGTQGDNEGPSASQSDGITFWRVDDSVMKHITAKNNGDNGVYFNGNNNRGEDILAFGNGDEGIDISSDSETNNAGSDYSGIFGGTTLLNVESYNNGDAAIEVEDNENEATITKAVVYDSPQGVLVPDNDNTAESDDADVTVRHSNILDSNDVGVENNGGATLDARNNWWGTGGISTAGDAAVKASYMVKSDMTLEGGETDKFGLKNDFAINLKPDDYTLSFEVVPQ